VILREFRVGTDLWSLIAAKILSQPTNQPTIAKLMGIRSLLTSNGVSFMRRRSHTAQVEAKTIWRWQRIPEINARIDRNQGKGRTAQTKT